MGTSSLSMLFMRHWKPWYAHSERRVRFVSRHSCKDCRSAVCCVRLKNGFVRTSWLELELIETRNYPKMVLPVSILKLLICLKNLRSVIWRAQNVKTSALRNIEDLSADTCTHRTTDCMLSSFTVFQMGSNFVDPLIWRATALHVNTPTAANIGWDLRVCEIDQKSISLSRALPTYFPKPMYWRGMVVVGNSSERSCYLTVGKLFPWSQCCVSGGALSQRRSVAFVKCLGRPRFLPPLLWRRWRQSVLRSCRLICGERPDEAYCFENRVYKTTRRLSFCCRFELLLYDRCSQLGPWARFDFSY